MKIHHRTAVFLTLFSGAAMVFGACARPSTSPAVDPSQRSESPDTPREEMSDTPYRLEQEGTAPPSADVAFEEDSLPGGTPAQSETPPEAADANPLSRPAVNSEVVEEEPVSVPVEPTVVTPVPPTERVNPASRGFRVQLAASTDHAEARRLAREAGQRLGTEVYVEFEAPYYKVRAGDFAGRGPALQLRDRAKGYGYAEAWVVATTIR